MANISRHCRTCGKFIYCIKSQNLFEQPDRILLCYIEAITGIELLQHSCMPTNICGPCLVALREAIFLRERIIKAQKILQSSSNAEEAIQKLNSEDLSSQQICSEEFYEISVSENRSDGEVDVSVEVEPQSPKSKGEIESKETASDIPEPKMASTQATKCPKTAERRPKKQMSSIYASVSFAESSQIVPRTDWSKLTEEEVVALKRERRKRDCICEQCGKHFSCPSNFKVHLLRHTGIKNYKCKMCSLRFYTAHLLRRHEIVHFCNRPYQCQFCEMTFSHYSGRIQHERNKHTNFKPYKCTECDKSFAVSGKLKTHMLCHSGVRTFHCEICTLSFLRKSHLKSHYQSKGHKLNFEAGSVELTPSETACASPTPS